MFGWGYFALIIDAYPIGDTCCVGTANRQLSVAVAYWLVTFASDEEIVTGITDGWKVRITLMRGS